MLSRKAFTQLTRQTFRFTPRVLRSSTITTMASEPSTQQPAQATYSPRYIDIGINLADPVFRGIQYGKRRHPDDLKAVVGRAQEVGCTKLIITGSDFESCRDALEIADEFPGTVYTTAGIHPCSSSIFGSKNSNNTNGHTVPCQSDPSMPDSDDHVAHPAKSAKVIAELTTLIAEARASGKNQLVAMGEFGLDYDRLQHCSKTVQLHSFQAQLRLAASLEPQLPLFLHSRAAHEDFVRLLKEAFGPKLEKLEKGGVVHSFTGTLEEMRELMDLGLYIGINGCSFKTAENCAAVKEVRLDRLMIETDGPWCEIRPSHEGYKYLIEKKDSPAPTPAPAPDGDAPLPGSKPKPPQQQKKNQKKEPDFPERFKSVKKEKWVEGAMIKGRNEPCSIERVAKVIAGIKDVHVEEVCEVAWRNTVKVFGVGETV